MVSWKYVAIARGKVRLLRTPLYILYSTIGRFKSLYPTSVRIFTSALRVSAMDLPATLAKTFTVKASYCLFYHFYCTRLLNNYNYLVAFNNRSFYHINYVLPSYATVA